MKDFIKSCRCILFYLNVLFFLLVFSEYGFAQNSISQPAIKKISEYLQIINSGDRDTIRNYILNHYDLKFLEKLPEEYHVTIQMSYYYMSAGQGYDFIELRDHGKNELNALIKNNFTNALINLRIPVSEELPHKINNFVEFKTTAVKPSELQAGFNDAEITEKIKKCLNLLVDDDEFSGTVIFARNGKPLFQGAFGLANKSYVVSNRLDTKFNIASVGKIFTAVAIAKLVEEGKLSFTDSLHRFLPSGWLDAKISEKIQIRHLLTHTSGLGDYFKKMYSQCDKFFFRELDDYKILTNNQSLDFEPGTRWSYSNTGSLLLGVVIENITGEDYFEYLQKNIFDPANMKNTDANEKDRPALNRSTGYLKLYDDGKTFWMNNNISRFLKGSPSGGCNSTVEDLLNFDIALRSNQILKPEITKEILSVKPEINSPFHGYGFFIEESSIGKIARHSGDGTGINAQFSSYLDAGYTVIALSNYSRPAAEIVDNVIYQLLVTR